MHLKNLLLFVVAFIFLPSCKHSTTPDEILDNEHFDFILYDGLSPSIIPDISNELENNYERIITDLQIMNMPAVTVKIWADYDNFLEAMQTDIGVRYTGATGYLFGMQEMRLQYSDEVSQTAVHEFAHLVSLQVNSNFANRPRWLWEAVALYECQDFVYPKSLPYMVSGDYPTLSELNTDFNSSNHSIYSVGYVLLEFVVQTWSMAKVIDLIKTNGNIPSVLGITTQMFESGWHQYVEDKYLNQTKSLTDTEQ